MSTKEQRRQKKLSKKRSKDVLKRKQQARERNSLQSLAGQIKAASVGAFEHCLISDDVLEPDRKLGTVWVSRRMPDRRLACVRFLIDGMCLGVKDIHSFTAFPADVNEMLENAQSVETLRSAIPERALKLVRSAVEYAEQFDLHPPADYKKVALIWHGVDADECTDEFRFGGEGGKPHYINGPNDSRFFQTRVIETLERTAGKGNYNFTFLGSANSLAGHDDYIALDDPELDVDIDEDVVDEEFLLDR
jgi:hypothetical protein